jgi:hypothetical protein
MPGIVKHISLHRIAGTELRIVADVEDGVFPVIQAEETVIRTYAQQQPWPHRYITLFILHNLTSLAQQLGLATGGDDFQDRHNIQPQDRWLSKSNLPMVDAAAVNRWPVVNVYDLADLESCHVFVNQQVMQQESYWDDPLALRGLLAHEHAHPLSENQTTLSSRQLQVLLTLPHPASPIHAPKGNSSQARVLWWEDAKHNRIYHVLARLANKFCLYGPREIFANELVISRGFHDALFHLDQWYVNNASANLAGRGTLQQQLQHEVTQGNLTLATATVLLLLGDLESYLDLVLETAAFYRAGRENDALALETILETTVFPSLDSGVFRVYTALREHYRALNTDLALPELSNWGQTTLSILAKEIADKGLELEFHLQKVEPD